MFLPACWVFVVNEGRSQGREGDHTGTYNLWEYTCFLSGCLIIPFLWMEGYLKEQHTIVSYSE